MFVKVNSIKWAKCPHCKVVLNSHSFVSIDAFANPYFTKSKCPSCHKEVGVKVRVEMNYEVILLEEATTPPPHNPRQTVNYGKRYR